MNQLVSSLTFKILIGIVLTAAMIISLFSLSRDLHVYLGGLENGDFLQLGGFGFLLVGSAIGLFYLLFNKKIRTETGQTEGSIIDLLSCDIKILGIKFMEGFISEVVKEFEKDKESKS